MSLPHTKAIMEERRNQANARQEAYDKLTIQEKIDRLPPEGAKRQRAKLYAKLEASKPVKVEDPQAIVEDYLDEEEEFPRNKFNKNKRNKKRS
jgi:hypothetical protein